MSVPIILASSSEIRARLLKNANVGFTTKVARLDEDAIRNSLANASASPRDVADALAEAKARKVSCRYPESLVIGADQVLSFDGRIMAKPISREDARAQLTEMRGKSHHLYSAAAICMEGSVTWRHVGEVRLHMRNVSDAYLQDYIERNWHSIRYAVGGYKLEEEGARLFNRIDGDYFNVLGMPLLQLLDHLSSRGFLDT